MAGANVARAPDAVGDVRPGLLCQGQERGPPVGGVRGAPDREKNRTAAGKKLRPAVGVAGGAFVWRGELLRRASRRRHANQAGRQRGSEHDRVVLAPGAATNLKRAEGLPQQQ